MNFNSGVAPQASVLRIAGICLGVITASLCTADVCSAVATVTPSSPYLSESNSTLNPLSPTYFLEDFEDGTLNLPGVGVSAVGGSGIQSGTSLSVDGDDGTIDGVGAGFRYSGATSGGIHSTTFFFSQVAGQWPKQVAIAVTAGSATSLSFGSYDTNSNPSGGLFLPVNSSAATADDFLVTFIDNSGISAIAMVSNIAQTFIHYDHLQFDTAPVIVPEPGAAILCICGLLIAHIGRRGRRSV
jgi:hypothetical protein